MRMNGGERAHDPGFRLTNGLYPIGSTSLIMDGSLKVRIFRILESEDEDSKYFEPFIMGLIILNVVAVILEIRKLALYPLCSDLLCL
jgi:hypothetical protein